MNPYRVIKQRIRGYQRLLEDQLLEARNNRADIVFAILATNGDWVTEPMLLAEVAGMKDFPTYDSVTEALMCLITKGMVEEKFDADYSERQRIDPPTYYYHYKAVL